MRIEIHHKIGKNICSEIKSLGFYVHEKLFLWGNIFPDIIQSYIWCRHEYKYSRDFIIKRLEKLKKKPRLFSFHLGVLAHYLCDFFCYSHSSVYNKGFIQHVIYEMLQKIPQNSYKVDLPVKSFSIEELDNYVAWYESFRTVIDDDEETDVLIANEITSNFLLTIYQTQFNIYEFN